MNDIKILKADQNDIKSVVLLYDCIHDDFAEKVNYCYPNWRKGVYPSLETAQTAFDNKSLYVLKSSDDVIGSCIIDHNQHPDYRKIKWGLATNDDDVMVVHALVTSPKHRRAGTGKMLVQFCIDYCRERGIKTIRLDTHHANYPAKRLYEKCGFQHVCDWLTNIDGVKVHFDVFEYIFDHI